MLGTVVSNQCTTVKHRCFVPGIYIFPHFVHLFVSPAKTLWRTVLNFAWIYVFLFHLHFFGYPFTLSIKWKFAVIINAFSWKFEGGMIFIIISYLLYCFCVAHLTCCVEYSNSAALETLVCSCNTTATPIPVSVAVPGYSTVHNMWWKMSSACIEWIHNGCLQ